MIRNIWRVCQFQVPTHRHHVFVCTPALEWGKTTCTFSQSSVMLGSSFPQLSGIWLHFLHRPKKVGIEVCHCDSDFYISVNTSWSMVGSYCKWLCSEWSSGQVFSSPSPLDSSPTFLVQGFCLPCHQICPVSADTDTVSFRCPFLQTYLSLTWVWLLTGLKGKVLLRIIFSLKFSYLQTSLIWQLVMSDDVLIFFRFNWQLLYPELFWWPVYRQSFVVIVQYFVWLCCF